MDDIPTPDFDDKPRAAPARFPYEEHRSLAEVMRDEERQRLAAYCRSVPLGFGE